MIFRKYIDAAEQKFPDQSNIQQKLMYLKALCSAIEKEQKELIIHLRDFENHDDASSSSSIFWKHITQVEQILFSLDQRIRQSRESPQTKLQPEQGEERDDDVCLPSLVENSTESAHTILSPALTFLSFFMDDASWIKEFLWKLRWCRAMLILQPSNHMNEKNNDNDVAIGLTDMEFCETSLGGNQEKRLAELFFLRAKALYANHDVEEAQKTLAKGILWDPSKHDDWSAHLGILQ
jgi:hypothetical protein